MGCSLRSNPLESLRFLLVQGCGVGCSKGVQGVHLIIGAGCGIADRVCGVLGGCQVFMVLLFCSLYTYIHTLF